jgi:hypothetical protein
MKTTRNLIHNLAVAGLAVTVLALVSALTTTEAQPKGAEVLLRLHQTTTPASLNTAKHADTAAMSCPKCKDITATVAEPTFKTAMPVEAKTVTHHLCSNCATKIVASGEGKAETDKSVHTCAGCGGGNAGCCAMTNDGRSMAGMAGMH